MNLREGDRVRVEFTGTVRKIDGWGNLHVNPDDFASSSLPYPVPPNHVTKIRPALKPGQVWVGQEGHRYFVLRTPKARMTLTTTEGKSLMPEDMDWDNLELVSDA